MDEKKALRWWTCFVTMRWIKWTQILISHQPVESLNFQATSAHVLNSSDTGLGKMTKTNEHRIFIFPLTKFYDVHYWCYSAEPSWVWVTTTPLSLPKSGTELHVLLFFLFVWHIAATATTTTTIETSHVWIIFCSRDWLNDMMKWRGGRENENWWGGAR